jgi:hypothetical protein
LHFVRAVTHIVLRLSISMSFIKGSVALKLLAEKSLRFKFLSKAVLRLKRSLLVGWEDGGTED